MSNYDDLYEMDDELVKHTSYDEFKLSKVDETNLSDIERSLQSKSITASNKSDSLGYLEKLHKQILIIKNKELEYEGEMNENVNEYLERIRFLIAALRKL